MDAQQNATRTEIQTRRTSCPSRMHISIVCLLEFMLIYDNHARPTNDNRQYWSAWWSATQTDNFNNMNCVDN